MSDIGQVLLLIKMSTVCQAIRNILNSYIVTASKMAARARETMYFQLYENNDENERCWLKVECVSCVDRENVSRGTFRPW